MIKEVAFVAIAVSDAERARKFYQETLELKPSSTAMGGAWVEYELVPRPLVSAVIPHGNLRVTARQSRSKWTTWTRRIETLKKRGVEFDMDKTETPVCWMAQFRDPDGNKLVVHQRKTK